MLVAAVLVCLPPPAANATSGLVTRLTATDFGADPTDVTDSTIGAQAAVNACESVTRCEVYFPAGVYRISSPLLTRSRYPVALAGVGVYASLLRVANTSVNALWRHAVLHPTRGIGFTVRDLDVQIAPK
jgi:hypothetical protein